MHLSRVKKHPSFPFPWQKEISPAGTMTFLSEWLAVTHAQLKMNPTTVLAEFKDYPTFTDRHNLIPTVCKKWKCNCLPSLTEIN